MTDKARDRSNDSYGLGLSIAKDIAISYRGKITAISNEVDGTVFSVSSPHIK